MFYLVTAVVTREETPGWKGTFTSPTFLLDSDIQGIVSSDHAERIALGMVRDMAGPDAEVYVSVNPAHDVQTV